ncbi:hypothetical protein GOP47_0022228 [Adiantum capillus-veneris]|uniref:TraB family protein n=1 Tax=Adiantum capillus-veneris TaxID=13818 RepID=A0A9D4U8Y2_ADICA|nr:hypothetical protein GOP47_0022228 [Adiantum capillus-veneris]
MWIRCGNLKYWTLHMQREVRRCSSVSCQYVSTSEQPVTYLMNSATKAKIYLVGVNHISARSAEHVRHVIRHHRPNVVAVELCKERAVSLLLARKMKERSRRNFMSMKGSIKENLLKYSLEYFYSYIGNETDGPLPGEELRVALEEGHAIGARFLFMDEDFKVTIRKMSKEFSLWEFLMFFLRNRKTHNQTYPNLHGAFLRIDQDNISKFRDQTDCLLEPQVIEEAIAMGDAYFPGLTRALLHERNEHMVKGLRNMEGNVVAVVGAGHVPGMRRLWQEAEAQGEEINASFS